MNVIKNIDFKLLVKQIAEIWARILQVEKVSAEDNFFELGGHSLLAQEVVSSLKNDFAYIVPVTKLYQFPTVSGIAKFLQQDESETINFPLTSGHLPSSSEVAVIGMAGRFPGANTIEELWEVLKNGKETIKFFTQNELDPSISSDIINDPDYVAARGIIDNADKFDAAFFDIGPNLAALMDPQQRVFLEIAWEVLEKTGYLPKKYNGKIGVFAGTGTNTYYQNNVYGHQELINQVGSFQVTTVNEKDYISSRTAYHLNLKGPAVSVYSASSTSLLAVTQAVQSIRTGQCDIAIAGAASITSPVNSGHLYQEGAMLSRDGHCRSFDADASGTVFSDGAGVILLKDLEAAKRDGDVIYAVIKGVGVNNDGGGKGSFTAPNSEGQANAIAMAIRDAAIDPSTISYIETHGTATPLGDPVEIDGLKMAFGAQLQHQFCAIGSVKSNIGHLTAAAGVTGLIKTVMALYHRQIPPSLGFVKPNPNINFEDSPFFVNTRLADWTSENVRRAGVSSFGVGGTNVHVVLEEFAGEMPLSSKGRSLQLITWSAKSASSLTNYGSKLAKYLVQNNATSLADVAFTLQTTRADFNYRRCVLAQDTGELTSQLLKDDIRLATNVKETPGELVFMFPGQGSQYLRMGFELYESEKIYREAIDECAELLLPLIELDIRQILFADPSDKDAADLLVNTRYTQPAIFVTEYALAKLWIGWGIVPSVFCGHSIGEFVAACFSGVFTLEDALKLVAIRARMVSELPRGSMLSVRATAGSIAAMMPETLSIAAINTDNLCVIAGSKENINAFAKLLNDSRIPNKLLSTSHAFHSSMMDPIVENYEKIVSKVQLNRPPKAIVSTVTGSWLTDAEATNPHYWAKHLRSTVLFAQATETILKQDNVIIVEVGPGNTLSTFVKQQSGVKRVKVITSLEKNNQQLSEYVSVLKGLGQLWLYGLQPDWTKFYLAQKRMKINLPTYCFDKKYCWIDPVSKPANAILNGKKSQNYETFSPPLVAIKVVNRKEKILSRIKEILKEASGIEQANIIAENTFIEMGLDSLLMTQVALTLKKEFKLPLTFRQLNEDLATPGLLATYFDEHLSTENDETWNVSPASERSVKEFIPERNGINVDLQPVSELKSIVQQLEILTKQVSVLQGIKKANNNEVDSPVLHAGLSIKNTNEVSSITVQPVEVNIPPVPGAKLGRDKQGNPGWYIQDKTNPNKFFLLEPNS